MPPDADPPGGGSRADAVPGGGDAEAGNVAADDVAADGAGAPGEAGPPVTPDGRYIAVRGRLWRRANPSLDPARRTELVGELMAARLAVRAALRGTGALPGARARVDAAKRALGERGPVWWTDGTPDLTRHLARTTPYAEWFAGLPPGLAGYGTRRPGPGTRRRPAEGAAS